LAFVLAHWAASRRIFAGRILRAAGRADEGGHVCPLWIVPTTVEVIVAATRARKKYIIGTLVYVLVMKLEARLRAFAAFARQRSFSAAAAELRISQPAVSKHIAELENALELKLVERTKRDGALTKAGEFVANHVLRAESLLLQAGLGAAQFRKSGAGTVSVVASSLTGRYLLPDIIAEFQHSHPDVRVTLQVGTAAQAVELLRLHHAELGFVAGTVIAPEIDTTPLFEYDVPIVGKPGLVPQRPSRDHLEKVTWISREVGSATRISSDAGLARLGIVPRRRLELPSNEAVVRALMRGYGITAISRYVVATELATGSLSAVRVRGWNVRNVLSVLRVRDATLTPSADRFQMLVRERLTKMARHRTR
jgi:DNA-binding transcriptional LysR family regulator